MIKIYETRLTTFTDNLEDGQLTVLKYLCFKGSNFSHILNESK